MHLDEPSVTDKGVDARGNWKHILDDIATRNINDIVLGGDLGEPESHHWLLDTLKGYNIDIILGNHDLFAAVSKNFNLKVLHSETELYYTHEDDYIRYIYLDSSSAYISNDQFTWLANILATTYKKIVVFIYHPVLEIETAVDRQYPLENREKIKNILQQCKKEVTIFCGHYHLNESRKEGNITQFITPAASFQIIKNLADIEVNTSFFGYRIISIDKDKINSEVLLYRSGVFAPSI